MTMNKDSCVGGTRSALWLSAACSQECRDPCFLFHPAASPSEEKTPHLCATGAALPKGLSLSPSCPPFLPPLLWNWKSAAAFPSNITRRNRETEQTDSKINTVEVVTRHLRESCVRCSLSSSKRTRAALLGLLPFVFLTKSHRSLSFLPFAHPRTHMWAHARIHVSLCPVPTIPMPLCPVNLLCATSISTALISGFLKGEEVNTAQQCLSNF